MFPQNEKINVTNYQTLSPKNRQKRKFGDVLYNRYHIILLSLKNWVILFLKKKNNSIKIKENNILPNKKLYRHLIFVQGTFVYS